MTNPFAQFSGVLTTPFAQLGGAPITLSGLLLAILIVIISFFASRIAVRLLARLRKSMRDGSTALYILEKFTGYGIALFGVVFALSTVGINLSSLAVFAGALGVGVGLGLQGVIKEFVSGLVLLFDNIVNVGDYVELPGANAVRGIVFEIGARATHIRTNDNIDVFVPNSRLIEERFLNWTYQGQTSRIHIPFSVAYGADKTLVREVVLKAAREIDSTLPESDTRRTQVWLVSFGDSALNFELVVWPRLEALKRPAAMRAAYTWAIDDALRGAAIEIPFPQRDIRIRAVLGREGEDAYHALGFKAVKPVADTHETAAAPAHNDAATDLARPEEPPPLAAKP